MTQLQKNIAVRPILEKVLVLNEPPVLEDAVDLYLGLELLAGAGLYEVGLGDDLYGVRFGGVDGLTPVYFRETLEGFGGTGEG